MAVHISSHPLIAHKLGQLRDKSTKPFFFRALIHEIGWVQGVILIGGYLLAYEATAAIQTNATRIVDGVFYQHEAPKISERIGLFPILRAGLGLSDSFISMIPNAKVYHLGLYRDHNSLEPVEYYNKFPVNPDIDVAIILDPMVATAGTAVAVVSLLKERGVKKIIMVCVVAVKEGLERLQKICPDIEIYAAVLDEKLNEIGYILPGLGDAGDRIFNTY